MRIILKQILKKQCEDMDWIQLAQDRVQWWAVFATNIHQRAHKSPLRLILSHMNQINPDSKRLNKVQCGRTTDTLN
jgi:hypothetical protein